MGKDQNNTPQIALDYIAEVEEKFIRIYDQETDHMVNKWVYPQRFRSDQQIADQYAYLNYKSPRVCNVTVPPGIRIKGYTAQNSGNPFMYELESGAGIVFFDDRPLPPPNPPQPVALGPRLVAEYMPDQEAHFVVLYDLQGDWERQYLFDPKQVQGKTAEQLKEFFNLDFVPRYICDAVLPPQTKIHALAIGTVRQPRLYTTDGNVTFSNERPL